MRLREHIKGTWGFSYDLEPTGLIITSHPAGYVISKFPRGLVDKIEIINNRAIIPVQNLQFFYDFFAESFPLYRPEDIGDIQPKLGDYLESLSDLYEVKRYQTDFKHIHLIDLKNSEVVMNLFRDIIRTAFPRIAKNMVDKQIVFMNPEKTNITFSSLTAVYNGLWKRFVEEPLIRTKLAEYYPVEVPPEIQNLIGDYAYAGLRL